MSLIALALAKSYTVSVTGENAREATSINNISNPHTAAIEMPYTTTFNKPRVNVLKFEAGGQNITKNEYTFIVGDGTSFTYDDDFVVFDNTIHLLNTFTTAMTSTTLGSGKLLQATFDGTIYKSVSNVEVT